jgi:glycerol-3-phosphate dehydrogenase (NAD(P)+)|tara:strand:+ start:664 stop:1722 length:1059 start_codon:yes stop_codon:yes gene_type:complete
MPKIAIIGTTSWGITLGVILARKGLEVRLWARTEEEVDKLNNKGPDPHLMPNVTFPQQLSFTGSLSEALVHTSAVIMAVPSQSMRQNIRLVKDFLKKSMLIVSAAKGLEIGSNKRMSEVIADEIKPYLNSNICVLSGPNLYKEVLKGLPASAVVAAEDETIAKKAQKLLTAADYRVYTNHDVVGVELGGALKNVIALGAGMVDGLGYGDNAKAAFTTRGLIEMAALGVALGASPLTLSGLSGLGDLIATCSSPLSRNHYVGMELIKGRQLQKITTSMDGVAEGVNTIAAVWDLAQKLELEMPITEKLYQVLYKGADAHQIITELLGARGRHELVGRKWKLFSFFKHHRRSRN